MSNTYIFLLYASIMFVMYFVHCQLNIWLWIMLVEKCRKAFVTMWKENYQNTRIIRHYALCIEILMIYGIINFHNHMYFFRYLEVFTIHSGVSFPLIVLIHVTWIVYKNPFSNQYLLSYFVPYMLTTIIVVSTSLNEQWS